MSGYRLAAWLSVVLMTLAYFEIMAVWAVHT